MVKHALNEIPLDCVSLLCQSGTDSVCIISDNCGNVAGESIAGVLSFLYFTRVHFTRHCTYARIVCLVLPADGCCGIGLAVLEVKRSAGIFKLVQ
jgi:hypothetical protein